VKPVANGLSVYLPGSAALAESSEASATPAKAGANQRARHDDSRKGKLVFTGRTVKGRLKIARCPLQSRRAGHGFIYSDETANLQAMNEKF
jgi:hypothetical protein